ncbi:DnaA N-terminal domain-containing protein, partial [Shimia sp.]|uniref:DnaA N-terminal domain-containing protein n=1 Tax=Shimia sp. TaxID=1954381 RepID=UPI003561FFF3
MTQEQWGALKKDLLKTLGQNNYKTWIDPLEFAELSEGVATFHVPTNFIGNYVSQNFGDLILHKLTTAGQKVQRVHFRVAANTPARPTSRPAPAPAQAEDKSSRANETVPGAPLDPRFTFDSFVVGKPNELANAAAHRVAE